MDEDGPMKVDEPTNEAAELTKAKERMKSKKRMRW